MSLTLSLIFIAAVAFVFMLMLQQTRRSKAVQVQLANSSEEQRQKLKQAQKEIQKLRNDLGKRSSDLKEARDLVRKKSKTNASLGESKKIEAATPASNDVSELKMTIKTLQQQVEQVQASSEAEYGAAYASKEKELSAQIATLTAELKKQKKEMDVLQGKANTISLLGGESIDLTELNPAVVNELARLSRKAKQNERLAAMSQNKVQLANEKYQEIQRRYFAVCRELALASTEGSTELSDTDARAQAEKVISTPATAAVKPENEPQSTGKMKINGSEAQEQPAA